MTKSPPARRFDLIAFDWDGTLSDSTALIAILLIYNVIVKFLESRPLLAMYRLSVSFLAYLLKPLRIKACASIITICLR